MARKGLDVPNVGHEVRMPSVLAGLEAGKNYGVIAGELGCSEVTVFRDVKEFWVSGEYEEWVDRRILELSQGTRVPAEKVLANLINLKTRLAEKKVKVSGSLEVEAGGDLRGLLVEYGRSIERAVRRERGELGEDSGEKPAQK